FGQHHRGGHGIGAPLGAVDQVDPAQERGGLVEALCRQQLWQALQMLGLGQDAFVGAATAQHRHRGQFGDRLVLLRGPLLLVAGGCESLLCTGTTVTGSAPAGRFRCMACGDTDRRKARAARFSASSVGSGVFEEATARPVEEMSQAVIPACVAASAKAEDRSAPAATSAIRRRWRSRLLAMVLNRCWVRKCNTSSVTAPKEVSVGTSTRGMSWSRQAVIRSGGTSPKAVPAPMATAPALTTEATKVWESCG